MRLQFSFFAFFCLSSICCVNAQKNPNTPNNKQMKNDCGEPLYEVPKVQTCIKGFHANAHKKFCKSYPSPPRKLKYAVLFEKDSKGLSLTISWDTPEYGENTLWGYDVLLLDSHHIAERCYQINGKKLSDRNFTFERVKFNRNYLVVVSSLPRRNRDMTNSIEQSIKSPDKCNFFKLKQVTLPFSCAKIENLTLVQSCNENGKAVISWQAPLVPYDEIFFELHSSCSRVIKDILLKKNVSSMSLDMLQNGCDYLLQAHLVSRQKDRPKVSTGSIMKFACNPKQKSGNHDFFWTPPLHVNKTGQLQVSPQNSSSTTHNLILYSSIGLLALAIIVIVLIHRHKNRKLFHKFKYRMEEHCVLHSGEEYPSKVGQQRGNSQREHSSDKTNGKSVMLHYESGCEYLKEFMLIFASVLHSNGIRVRLDLLETDLMAQLGNASYYEAVEKEADYVIIICSNATVRDSLYNKQFNFILGIIKEKMMEGRDRSKYLPVYFDNHSSVSDAFRGFSKKLPDDLEYILERLHGIQSYDFSTEGTLPLKNDIVIKGNLTSLSQCIENVLQRTHQNCVDLHCHKGISSLLIPKNEDLANSFVNVFDEN